MDQISAGLLVISGLSALMQFGLLQSSRPLSAAGERSRRVVWWLMIGQSVSLAGATLLHGVWLAAGLLFMSVVSQWLSSNLASGISRRWSHVISVTTFIGGLVISVTGFSVSSSAHTVLILIGWVTAFGYVLGYISGIEETRQEQEKKLIQGKIGYGVLVTYAIWVGWVALELTGLTSGY